MRTDGHLGEEPTRIFIRDDDVGALTPEFRSFFELFRQAGLPVSYQIIPVKFTAECADFLKAERKRNPGLIELGQHGLRHEMMVRGKRVNHEFGPERTYEQQLSDIRAGFDLLRERLGPDEDVRVFTPPRHRYDRNTLKAVKAAGFLILSASSYTTLPHRLAYWVGRSLGLSNLGRPGVPRHGGVRPDSGLFELSVAVGADDGHAILGSVDQVMARVEQARRHTRDVGVLFHHQAFCGAEGRVYLERFVAQLQSLSGVSFHSIGALCDRAGPT